MSVEKTPSGKNILELFYYPVLLGVFFWADVALAQISGAPAGFENFVKTTISVVQGLALVGCTLAFIRVGMKFNDGDPDAMRALKNTAIGTAIVAGAAALLQFVKGFFVIS